MVKGSLPGPRVESASTPVKEALLARKLPGHYIEQSNRYTREALLEQPAGAFNPHKVNEQLQGKVGQHVVVIDIGGDKFRAAEGVVAAGGNVVIERTEVLAKSQGSELGSTYVEPLQRVGKAAADASLPVGISTAGVVKNGHLDGTYNIKNLVAAIDTQFGGDMKQLVPTLASIDNDAPPPLKATLVEAVKQHPEITNAVEIILGGGLGGTVFLGGREGNGTIFALEPGHIPVVEKLQQITPNYEVKQLCEVGGQQRSYVCVENVAGGKAMGTILQTLLAKSQQVSGHDMITTMQNGNPVERETVLTVLDNAANTVAHVVEGLDHAYDGQLLSHPETTLLAWHGGIFEIPGFRDRVEQILQSRLQEKLGRDVNLVTMKTKDVSENSALVGAAVAALSLVQ